jgi:hypothetical protein
MIPPHEGRVLLFPPSTQGQFRPFCTGLRSLGAKTDYRGGQREVNRGKLKICPGPRYRARSRDVGIRGFLMPADVENIIELLGPREVIGQAIGLLMTEDDVTRDTAFALLVQGSSSSHRKVREIAAEIVQQRKVE